jgi:hypothetical protein
MLAKIEIQCMSCCSVYSFECSDLDWECVESNEREMGKENHYEASIHDKCQCSQQMKITFECWEYPIGVLNSTDMEISGAILLDNECEGHPNFYPQDQNEE